MGSGDGSMEPCRKPLNVAAEVLNWIHVELHEWEEAFEWDQEP